MLGLEFQFLTGRFHATPWGRNVNEGSVEWPPSPWRLHRALLFGWLLAAPERSQVSVEALLGRLAANPPCFHLPPSANAHTRHYVPSGDERRLMLDAFTAVERDGEPVVAIWPELDLDETETELLDSLVKGVRYLGRSESWVRVQRTTRTWSVEARPLGEEDPSNHNLVTLLAPEPMATLEQCSATTGSLRKAGWSRPPGSRWVTYQVQPAPATPGRPPAVSRQPTYLTYFLRCEEPIPREKTLPFADRFRRLLVRQEPISATLSGKDQGVARQDNHRHLHILPDGPGAHLDRLVLWAPEGFSEDDLRVLTRLVRLPAERGGPEVDLLVSRVSGGEDQPAGAIWESFTPFLAPRHTKPDGRDSLEEQLVAECHRRGLPSPVISTMVGEFPRYGNRRGPRRAPGAPVWLRLEFPGPVSGPICLGASCHFGMGRFKPT